MTIRPNRAQLLSRYLRRLEEAKPDTFSRLIPTKNDYCPNEGTLVRIGGISHHTLLGKQASRVILLLAFLLNNSRYLIWWDTNSNPICFYYYPSTFGAYCFSSHIIWEDTNTIPITAAYLDQKHNSLKIISARNP